MSDPTPSPESTPPPTPEQDKKPSQLDSLYYKSDPSDKSGPPSKKVCAGIGLAVLVVSILFSIAFPPLFLAGLGVAIASLFFKGYRFIFVGYIITVGLLLLAAIIYCAYNPLRID